MICHDGGSTPVFKVQENGYTTALRYYLEDTGAVIYRNNNDLELNFSGYDINLVACKCYNRNYITYLLTCTFMKHTQQFLTKNDDNNH